VLRVHHTAKGRGGQALYALALRREMGYTMGEDADAEERGMTRTIISKGRMPVPVFVCFLEY